MIEVLRIISWLWERKGEFIIFPRVLCVYVNMTNLIKRLQNCIMYGRNVSGKRSFRMVLIREQSDVIYLFPVKCIRHPYIKLGVHQIYYYFFFFQRKLKIENNHYHNDKRSERLTLYPTHSNGQENWVGAYESTELTDMLQVRRVFIRGQYILSPSDEDGKMHYYIGTC